MLWLENNPTIEILDNETTLKQANQKLEKKERDLAINILKEIDSKVTPDIDLVYNDSLNKFNFIWNEKILLNISLDIWQLNILSKMLPDLFNMDIQLFGSLFGRSISEDTWKPDWIEKNFITTTDSSFTKNEIEELFIFIMKTRGISLEDWEIANTVCANWNITKECKLALWD